MNSLFVSLAVLFFFAFLGALFSNRIKQVTLLGLLLAGAVIGPKSLGLIGDDALIDFIVQVGAILLLFVIGLEFDLPRLMRVGAKGAIISLFKIGLTLLVGFAILSWIVEPKAAVLLSLVIAFSSTVTIVKILEQKNLFSKSEVPLLLSILIIEDVVAVFLLSLLTSLHTSTASLSVTFENLVVGLVILLALYVALRQLLQPVVAWILRTDSEDLVVISISVFLCAAFSWLSALLGFSAPLGAFLAGSLIGSMKESKSFEHAVKPYTMIFSALFFVAMGTLVDFSAFSAHWVLVLVLLGVLLATRFLTVGLLSYLVANLRGEQAVFASIAMFSVGEFSLLLASQATKFLPALDLITITSAVIFLSTLITSVTISYSPYAWGHLAGFRLLGKHSKLATLSQFIRSIFEEIDMNSAQSIMLKRNIRGAIALFLASIMSVAVWRKAVLLVEPARWGSWGVAGSYALLAALVSLFLVLKVKKTRRVLHSLAHVLANRSFTRNLRRSQKIVTRLYWAMMLALYALFFPLLVFIFDLNHFSLVIPAALLLAAALLFLRCYALIETSLQDTAYPQYQRYTDAMRKPFAAAKPDMETYD